MHQRWGNKYGDTSLTDGLSKDGLTDVYHNYPMGNAAELCASKYNFTREDQDAFAVSSYTKSRAAWEANLFDAEIVPVPIPQRNGDPIMFSKDEEPFNVKFEKIPGTSKNLPADMVLLAMGFTGPEKNELVNALELKLDPRGNIARDNSYRTNVDSVYICGDAGRGQSLIVWAIAEGRSAASAVDADLMGHTQLPSPIEPTARPLTV